MKTPVLSLVLILSASLGLGLIGCAPSKEDQAVSRLKNIKRPGFARLVNFTDMPSSLKIDNKPGVKADPTSVSAQFPAAAGARTFSVEVDGKTVEAGSAEVATNQLVTAYALPGGKVALSTNDLRDTPADTPTLQVTVLGATGTVNVQSAGKDLIKAAGAGTSDPVDIDTYVKELTVTDSAGKKLGTVNLTVEPKVAYTVAVFLSGGKAQIQLLRNTPNRKPTTASGFAGA